MVIVNGAAPHPLRIIREWNEGVSIKINPLIWVPVVGDVNRSDSVWMVISNDHRVGGVIQNSWRRIVRGRSP